MVFINYSFYENVIYCRARQHQDLLRRQPCRCIRVPPTRLLYYRERCLPPWWPAPRRRLWRAHLSSPKLHLPIHPTSPPTLRPQDLSPSHSEFWNRTDSNRESLATAPNHNASSCKYFLNKFLLLEKVDDKGHFFLKVLRLLRQWRVLSRLQLRMLRQQFGTRGATVESHPILPGSQSARLQAEDRSRMGSRAQASQQRVPLQAVGMPQKLLRVLRGNAWSTFSLDWLVLMGSSHLLKAKIACTDMCKCIGCKNCVDPVPSPPGQGEIKKKVAALLSHQNSSEGRSASNPAAYNIKQEDRSGEPSKGYASSAASGVRYEKSHYFEEILS